ncbi:MAG: hypothetical protein KDA46_14235 [Parvularculaceae bacterium]|nr:hypothetical protein [Parvularculaceae bacterium]
MILRRVIDHVKSQAWTAVFLDFVIVVVGVFIGIQVSNWNGARHERAEQNQVELRLRDDFHNLYAALSDALLMQEKIILSLNTLNTAIERGRALDGEDEAIKYALVYGRAYPTFARKSATYSELISSGRLNLIRDDALRAALAIYNERIDNSLYNIQQIREPINTDLLNLSRHAILTPISKGDVGIQSVLSYDMAAMVQDEEFRRKLDTLTIMQTWIYSNLANQKNAIDAVKQAMEAPR